MNWFTKGFKVKVTGEMDHCEHLEEGDTAHVVHTEMDSFGTVGKIALCEACEKERLVEEKEHCRDCGGEFSVKYIHAWRWYDFYAPQGDEPYLLCKECWGKPKHQQRMAKDQAMAESDPYFNGDYE